MGDFYQTGMVTTLHRLNPDGLPRLEAELEEFSEQNPIGLVLPALYSEFETSSMIRIRAELARVRYLRRIVVVLGRADARQYEHVREFFKDFSNVTILWVDGERTQALFQML